MIRTESDLHDHYEALPRDEAALLRLRQSIGQMEGQRTETARTRRSRRLVVAGTLAGVLVLALVAGLVGSRLGSGHATTTATPGHTAFTGPTFLTIHGDTGDGYASQVELRAATDGRVLAVLFHAPGGVQTEADQTPDGSVLVAATRIDTCRTTLSRIDPRTGHSVVIARFPEWVSDLSVSPDADRIAFTTYATCPGPFSNLPRFFPSVLVIRTLATGAEVRTATPPTNGLPFGDPFFGLAWSPDGSKLVAWYAGNANQLLVMDTAHPSFRAARRIAAPAGCQYFAPAWSEAGLLAIEGCRAEPMLSPSRLVLLDSSGHLRASWPLPSCIDGVHPVTDPSGRRTFLQTDIGYGGGPAGCAGHWATHIWRLEGRLTPVLTIPGEATSIDLVG